MGTLRTVLALCVVSFHTEPFFGVLLPNGQVAVQSFYVISGFYMALILTEKYASDIRAFYVNRAIRLYPIYWAALLISIVLSYLTGIKSGFTALAYSPMSTWFIAGLSNASLVGQDLLQFWGLDVSGHIVFVPHVDNAFLVIPQSWTIGVEIGFYALAPFVIRQKTLFLVSVLVASLVLRHFAYVYGLNNDPWTYRFLPFELALFMSGALGYRVYAIWLRDNNGLWIKAFSFLVAVCIAIATINMQWLLAHSSVIDYGYGNAARWYYILAVIAAVPLLFAWTKRMRFDNAIGQLSYPIYMTHYIFIMYAETFFRSSPLGYGVSVALASVVLSIGLIWATGFVDRWKIDRGRKVAEQTAYQVPAASNS